MKKTLLAALIGSAVLLTSCQDKEAQAKIEQLNQTVAQLMAENTQLKANLNAEKVRIESIIPAIFAEEDVIFKKSETFKYPKSKEDYMPEEGKIEYAISTLKTNVDWLNTLLWEEATREDGKVPTREQAVAYYQNDFEDSKKEMLKDPIIGYESSRWVDFIGQKEKLATFAARYYDFGGGAHGVGGSRYFTLDMTSHEILTLKDLFDEKALPEVKELLWKRYTNYGEVNDKDTFTPKADFNVSQNIYLDSDGIHFIYGVYEIGSYAEGEQDLTLGWWQLTNLLKPSFKDKNYVKLVEESKE